MPGDDDERERPKRSWRDIDKMRDRSGTRTSSDRERERVQNTTQYTRYKQGLDKLFKGGDLPPELRARLDPSGEGAERDEALRKIGAAEDAKAFAAAADEFLARFELPDDAFLLDRLLEHPRLDVVNKAFDKLESLVAAGTLKPPPRSLPLRLQTLELSHDDPDVQARAAALRKKLR